jgi:signal transduction histidine kinase
MLDVLCDRAGGEVNLSPQPMMADIEELVRRCGEAGVPVELTIHGECPSQSSGAEMAGFRIVQEALTNVIKHAGRPASASVNVIRAHQR